MIILFHRQLQHLFVNRGWKLLFVLVLSIMGTIGMLDETKSAGFQSPEECLAYEGEAHLNCLYAYIEIQKDKLSKFEQELNDVKTTTQELQNQVTRQTTVTEELKRSIERRDQQYQHYSQLRVIPHLGFSFNFGRPYHYRHYGFRYGFRFFSPYYGPYYDPYFDRW